MEVIEVMSRFAVIERASIDEAYMDLTAAVQQRLKDMTERQVDSQMLGKTYIQGFPQKCPENDATGDNDTPDKGNMCPTASFLSRHKRQLVTLSGFMAESCNGNVVFQRK